MIRMFSLFPIFAVSIASSLFDVESLLRLGKLKSEIKKIEKNLYLLKRLCISDPHSLVTLPSVTVHKKTSSKTVFSVAVAFEFITKSVCQWCKLPK